MQEGGETGRSAQSRAVGAIVGMFVGDALGLGCHWYYDLQQLRDTHGWVTDYIEPREGRYHYGCKAGDVSQTGQLSELLLTSVCARRAYDEEDFCRRWDDELLSTLDGTRYSGRYTAKDMCDVWKNRRRGVAWGEAGSPQGDTTDGCARAAIIAARYAFSLPELARNARSNARLQYCDPQVQTQSMSFGIILGALIRGMELSPTIGFELRERTKEGELPYTHAVLAEEKLEGGGSSRDHEEDLPEPDSLFLPSISAAAARNPAIVIEPAYNVALVYGQACAFYMVIPAAYYLAAKFPTDFESAVLHAVNGGGQNVARASLVGALVGAMVGIEGIPQRFIDGLEHGSQILEWATQVARLGTEGL